MKFAMSSLGVVVIFLVVVQALATKEEDFEPVRVLCLERNDITEEEFKALAEEQSVDGIEKKFKCFAHCVAEEMDYLDEMGKINVEKMEEEGDMNEEQLAKAIECRDKHDTEEDPCEYSFQIMTCFMGLM